MITNFKQSDIMSEYAQTLIPGGCHTYSKGVDQSPKLGPKIISRGKGSHIWDIDNNEYIDWSMGLASVSLGHAYEPVLEAVRNELIKGSNFQCASPIEIELAELFLDTIKGDMVKFAKNGSTVTTAALKLSRAYTNRKYVAYCSDHGFFSYDDWYIGNKPNNLGVPEEVSKLSLTFRYNDIESVKNLFDKYPNQIAAIILEPMEFDIPSDNFLHNIKDLCKKNGTVFILDEMITGFRLDYPGAHKMLNIDADLITWGKGIANGFSTCMLSGKKEIMNLGGINHNNDKVFLISTTHGAETHSLAAAIQTIKSIKNENSVYRNMITGNILNDEINKLIKQYKLSNFVEIKGHPCWLLMNFKNINREICNGFKTLFMQEVIKDGIFFRGSFVPTISHTQDDIDRTLESFNKAFKIYKYAIEDKDGYKKFLIGEPVKPVFRKKN